MNDVDRFIQNNFRIRYCYKYKGVSFGLCECGRQKKLHKEKPTAEDKWSQENNTTLKICDSFGSMNFSGYDNVSKDHKAKFIRFNCDNESVIDVATYRLLTSYWKFPRPRLIISVNGGYKRMAFKDNQQKKTFKQGLIEVMKKEITWVIGGGFNVGIHKLVGEAVYEYKLHYGGYDDQVKLIGISTWGVVRNKEDLLLKESSDDVVTYPNSNLVERKKVTLDAHYDCFLFCDDGTENQYGKETEFRLKFVKYIQEQVEAFAVQILYEGGKHAIENSHLSLQKSIPLVVIKGSGRAADIISEVLDLPKSTFRSEILNILDAKEDILKIRKDELRTFQKYLFEMYTTYRKYIVIHDIFDKTMSLDKKILSAIISSQGDNDLEQLLNLTIRFNCFDIAEINVFQDPKFSKVKNDVLCRNFQEVLENNRSEFVQLFLQNNFDIEDFLREDILENLYQKSISTGQCRCSDLIYDLILNFDKSFRLDKSNGKLLDKIYRIVRELSGNILKKRHYTSRKRMSFKDSNNESSVISRGISHFYKPQTNQYPMTSRELFLWAILSGYTEIAKIFWKVGKDHIGSALIGSIILNKMGNLMIKRGYSDMSVILFQSSTEFQNLAINLVQEAYNKNQTKTYTILIRALKQWDNLTCLQIAISGDLLEFLNISACKSYTRKAWMGELSPFLPLWKILVTIPLSPILIRLLIFPSVFQKKSLKEHQSYNLDSSQIENPSFNPYNRKTIDAKHHPKIYYVDAIIKFYQAPIVKFIVHLFSYILFLFLFSYLNMVELKPLQDNERIEEYVVEFYVYLYLFGMFIEEIRQVVDQERTGNFHKLKAYLSGPWNLFDITVIVVFVISIILRIYVPKEDFMVVRCFYAVTFSMFCIRAMQFYFINPSIGPKVVMIRKMIVDILFFLSIFVLFLTSYGTLVQSLNYPNRNFSLILIKDVYFYPYFHAYGELMLDNLDAMNPCNNETCSSKSITIIIGFAIFLLLTNVLLINLLIAMFGHTFKKIQGESEKFFSFIQIQLVEEFHEKPLLPPPFNIIYYFITIILRICKKICNEDTKFINSFLVRHLSDDENIKVSGFEQLCLESSLFDSKLPKLDKSSFSTDILSEKVIDYIERSNEYSDFNSVGSTKSRYTASRIEKLEQQFENLILNNFTGHN